MKIHFFYCVSLNPRLNSHYEAWSYKKKKNKKIIRESSCAKKEIADVDILVTSRNGDRKIMQSIRITSRPPSSIRKWNQLSQLR